MVVTKPQVKPSVVPTREVKAPGSATPQVVEPGVTYAFNILLDKVGSTAVAQFHLPLNMDEGDMQMYTARALHVIEMVQLKFDRDKLKVELKLSGAMLDSLKEEFNQVKAKNEEEAKRSGNGKLAKPVSQQLIALDNNYRNAQKRHDAMLADFTQMEKRLGGTYSSANS